MLKKTIKFLRNSAIILVIFSISFSNVPFYSLTKILDSYVASKNIVDRTWHLSQDENVVDKFASFRNMLEGVKIYEAQAAVSFVGSATASGTNASYNLSLTALTGGIASSPTEGDIVVAVNVIANTTNGNPGVGTAGYAELIDLYRSDNNDTNLSVSYKIMGVTPDTAVSCNPSSGGTIASNCVAMVFRGVDTATPIDVTSVGASGANTEDVNCPAITPVTSGAIVLCTGGAGGASVDQATPTAPSGYSGSTFIQTDPGSAGAAVASYKLWAGGAEDPAPYVMDLGTASANSMLAATLALRPRNYPPTITVSQPDGTGDTVTVGDLYNVTYDLNDNEEVVTAVMYYDTDATGLNGTPITGACSTAAEGAGATCSWDTTGMTPGTYYVYGVADDLVNPPVNDYSPGVITINAPASVLTVGINGSQTANLDSGSSNAHLGGAFTLSINTGTASVSNIKVSNNGTAGNLSDIRLYYDTDGTYSGAESCFNTVCTDGGGGTLGTGIAGSMGTLSSGTTYYVYVVADIASSVAGGGTIDLQITNPSTDITTSATNTDTAAKNITGLTTVRPNVTDATDSALVDGGRNGETFTITGAGFGTACGSLSVVVGGLTLTCNSANNTTISATIPSTQITTYGGASSMLVTVGGTADDASQTYYVYPSVNLVSTPLVSNAARELENITLTNSTANASRFGATQGTVTFSGGFGSVSGSVVSWGDTSIEVTVPAGILDNIYTGDITVTRNADSKTDLAYDSDGFRILPRITLLTPNSGPNGQSTTIDGDHLCQPSGTCQSAATFNGTADDGNDVEWGTTDAVVTGTPTNTQIIANAPTLSDGGYQVTVTSGGGTSYTSNELTFTIANNASPTLSISAPPGGNTAVAEGSSYNVTYTLGDTDNVVTAAFYYDTNGDGVGGVAITGCGTKAEGTGATCSFDTSVLSVSTPYYVYGVTSDGVNPTVTTVSSGTITVSDAPTLSISAPPGGNTAVAEGSSYNVTYTLSDTDNVVTSAFYYDTNGDGVGGVAITGCGTKAEGTGATCSFDTSVLSVSTPYYVYGVTSDGVNPTVTTVSSGTITVNDAPTITVSQPDGTGDTVNAGDLYNITYTLADTDNVVTAAMYYDTDAVGLNGTAITGACATAAEGTGATCSWDTTGISPGTYYVYGRGVNDGVNAEVSDYSPGMITINAPPQVVASSVGTQTANFDSGATGQYVGAAWTFRQTTGSADTITALTLSDVGGSVNANIDLSNAFLRYEQPGASTCTYNGTETSTGTVGFNASDQAVFSGLTIPVTLHATNVTCVYLIFDFKNGTDYPAGGQTFEPEITSSANFTLQNSTAKAGTYPVTLSGTTTVRPNVTDVTSSPLGDGGRNGETFTITGTGFGSSCASVSVVVGGLTLTCNSAATTTISATIPSTQTTTYGGASSMLVTVGGTADDASQTYYVYPSVNLVSTPLVSNAARELDNITLTNSTANASRFGATEGTVTFTGGFGSVGATVVSWGDTSIEVTVPSAIGDTVYLGDITVTRNADSKTDTAYGSNGFRVLPRITSNTPNSGIIADRIKITGDHLCQGASCPISPNRSGANDNVKFGSTQALDGDFVNSGAAPCSGNAQAWTDTEICVNVPAGTPVGAQPTIVRSNAYNSDTMAFTVSSIAPTDPTNLIQKDANIVTITTGETASSTPIRYTFDTSSGISGGTMYAQVEVRPVLGVNKDFTSTCSANPYCFEGLGTAYSGGTINLLATSTPADDIYHWQARVCYNKNGTHTTACDGTGDNPSALWVSYGGNAETATDFKVDTTAPVIQSVSSSGPPAPGTNTATITWTTDDLATSQVQYQAVAQASCTAYSFASSCSTNNDCTTVNESLVYSPHITSLSNLNSGTPYCYRVRSKDAVGNERIDTNNYWFTTDPISTPAKTTSFYIVGSTAVVTSASPLSQTFSVVMPENATSTKSIFVEIKGIYDITATSPAPSYTVQVNSETPKTYILPAVVSKSYFKILHQVNAINISPSSNTLTITPDDTNVNIHVSSADINVTYGYTP